MPIMKGAAKAAGKRGFYEKKENRCITDGGNVRGDGTDRLWKC